MYATIPVYKYSLTDAVNYKERELWLESYNINMECKRAIEERATTAFNTRELDLLIKDLVEKFGVERALYVLSKSVQENDWDTRFTEVVRDRSGVYDFHNLDEQQTEKTQDYVIKEIDPCVLDCIYLGLMKIEIDLNLASHDEYFEMLRENVGCDCEVDGAEECL